MDAGGGKRARTGRRCLSTHPPSRYSPIRVLCVPICSMFCRFHGVEHSSHEIVVYFDSDRTPAPRRHPCACAHTGVRDLTLRAAWLQPARACAASPLPVTFDSPARLAAGGLCWGGRCPVRDRARDRCGKADNLNWEWGCAGSGMLTRPCVALLPRQQPAMAVSLLRPGLSLPCGCVWGCGVGGSGGGGRAGVSGDLDD